tara:strand:- start:627 stop:1085 length:459 start_codon:yes stop_codon:yes gene_type:complete
VGHLTLEILLISGCPTNLSSCRQYKPNLIDIINTLNSRGQTLLYVACRFGTQEVVEMLLGCPGIDVNTPNSDGSTPAIGMAWDRCQGTFEKGEIDELFQILTLLKTKGSNFKLSNQRGETVTSFLNTRLANLQQQNPAKTIDAAQYLSKLLS